MQHLYDVSNKCYTCIKKIRKKKINTKILNFSKLNGATHQYPHPWYIHIPPLHSKLLCVYIKRAGLYNEVRFLNYLRVNYSFYLDIEMGFTANKLEMVVYYSLQRYFYHFITKLNNHPLERKIL